MFILTIGLNHKTAPLYIRERVSLNHGQLNTNLCMLSKCVEQGVILSTCNRTEIYALVKDPHVGSKAMRQLLSHVSNLSQETLSPHLYIHSQQDAVRHIFSVAAGTDSMILGESEVLGQLRAALEEAEACGTSGSELSRLLRHAISVGREVRDKTGINRNRTSVSSAGVDLAKRCFGHDLSACRVLVISAGEAGKLTAKAMADCAGSNIMVTSRTHEKAVSLAQELGGSAIPFSQLREALAQADIVISSTAAPHFILDQPDIEKTMQQRPERPLLFIDIAVPRDIDPDARNIKSVSIYDLDDLGVVAQENMEERKRELTKVNSIIDSETDRFMSWWNSLGVIGLISFMRNRAEEVRSSELEKALSKLKNVSEADKETIEILTKSIVNKMLHHPTIALKECAGDHERLDIMQRALGLEHVGSTNDT